MPRSRRISNTEVAPLELEHLDTPIERQPIIPAKRLLAQDNEKQLLGAQGDLAQPVGAVTAEEEAQGRGASPTAIAAEVAAQDRFRQTELASMATDREGNISPTSLRESVNHRLEELRTDPEDALVSSAKEYDRASDMEVPVAKPITSAGAEAMLLKGTDLITNLWDDGNAITYQDDGETVPIRNFVTASLGANVKPRMAGVALISGMATAFNDPALVALHKRPGMGYKKDAEKHTKDISAFKTTTEAKQVAFPTDAEGNLGDLDPKAYSIMFAALGQGVQNAREILGVETATQREFIEGDDDIDQQMGKGDRAGDPETGEAVMQWMLDEGLAKIMGYRDPATDKMRYYPALTNKGATLLPTAISIESSTVPGKTQVKKMSRVPTSWRENIGHQPKDKTEVKHMVENDSPTADQVYMGLLGGVPLTPDGDILKLLNMALADPEDLVVAKYVKMDETKIAESFRKVQESESNKMMNQLVRTKVKDGHLTQEQARQQADAFGTQQAEEHIDRLIKQERRKMDNELGMLQDVLNDRESAIRYIEYGIGRNKRVQAQSRDGQMESKAITRAALGFQEMSSIDRQRDNSPEALKKDARRVFDNIFTSPGKSRNGWDVLEGWDQIPQQDLEAMQLNAIFARTHIQMFGGGMFYSTFHKTDRPLNLRRMTPADLLDYFAQNRDQIMGDLATVGNEVQGWINAGEIDKTSTFFNDGSNNSILFKRGEAGFRIATVLDAAAYMNPDDSQRHFDSRARLDIDSNNSNVGIHALKAGGTGELGTLGFLINTEEIGEWFDTTNNPDSFYDVLAFRFHDAVNEIYEGDDDSIEALHTFFDNTIGRNKDWKTWSRQQVVHGFYGLHPIVNSNAIRELKVEYATEYGELLKKFNGDETKTDNALKAVRGLTYDTVLGSVSQTKIMNNSMAALTFFGEDSPIITTDTGAELQMGIGELMPSYLKDTVFESSGLKAAPDVTIIKDKDGNLVPELRRRQRYDYEIGRGHFNEDGSYEDLRKPNGIAIGESASATITHTVDAALEKIAILAQNAHRGKKGQQPMPNIPIHDANILNSKSYFQHWTAYNMIAMPAVAAERGTFLQVYDAAMDMHQRLKQYSKVKAKKNEQINVGRGPGSQHRAIFGVLDYWNKRINGKGLGLPKSEQQKHSAAKQEKEFGKLLEEAKKSGYIPYDAAGKNTDTVLVDPDDFIHLVNIAYHMLGLRNIEPSKKTALQRKIQGVKQNQDLMLDAIEAGYFISNTQN